MRADYGSTAVYSVFERFKIRMVESVSTYTG